MNTVQPVRIETRRGNWAELYHADCLDLLPIEADAVIFDPPFSARTHNGHDNGLGGYDGSKRGSLGYSPWGLREVKAVYEGLPKTGWTCIFTDHSLAVDWLREMERIGRYVFAPLPVVTPGRSVRLNGDGPSSWTDWLIVSRSTSESKWGTLPGYYHGHRGQIEHMGGKPTGVMIQIVEHYTREGQTVADICMGSGTTGVACLRTGRNFIGIEIDEQHFNTAVERIRREAEAMLL